LALPLSVAPLVLSLITPLALSLSVAPLVATRLSPGVGGGTPRVPGRALRTLPTAQQSVQAEIGQLTEHFDAAVLANAPLHARIGGRVQRAASARGQANL
jgi:hypothetical protein